MPPTNVFIAHIVLLFSRKDFVDLVWVGRVSYEDVPEIHLPSPRITDQQDHWLPEGISVGRTDPGKERDISREERVKEKNLDCAWPVGLNLPKASTLNKVPRVQVTPGHKIIFIATS